MYAIKQEPIFCTPLPDAKGDSGHPVVINTADNVDQVMSAFSQGSNDREADLEKIAVLGYD